LQKVIFDSSFLMAVADRPTSWFNDINSAIGKFEPVALDCVTRELKRLGSKEGKKAMTARVALEMASSFKIAKCGQGSTDAEIMSLALAGGASVATADGDLASQLMKAHVKVFGLRDGRVFSR